MRRPSKIANDHIGSIQFQSGVILAGQIQKESTRVAQIIISEFSSTSFGCIKRSSKNTSKCLSKVATEIKIEAKEKTIKLNF